MTVTGYAQIDGGELAWRSDGDGSPLVLVHAGVADQRMWDPIVPMLERGLQVIRYDMRGFGSSRSSAGTFLPPTDLLALLDAFELARVAVVGASFGGLVALEAAAIAPERVRALVLLAPNLDDHEPSPELRAFAQAEERSLSDGRMEDAVELNLATWVDRSTDDAAIRGLVADMQRRAFEVQLDTEIELEGLDPPVPTRLGTIDLPVTIAVGECDLSDFQEIAERLGRELPQATVHRIAGAGHLLALERPVEIAELIAAAVR